LLTSLATVGLGSLALAHSQVSHAGQAASPANTADSAQVTDAPRSSQTQDRHAYLGPHQSGIVTPRPAAGLVASFDILASNRTELRRLFVTLTERIAFLTQGGPQADLDPRLPPAGSGILGPVVSPDNLTVTVSVGDTLFDERFGLAKVKPAKLQPMTGFKNDALDEDLCHGDLSLQFCANTPDTNIHALRDIVKNLPDLLVLRWKQEGSVPPVAAQLGRPPQSARNFLGFRDGSANPDSADAALMNRIVWVQPGSPDEPAWAAHGSYQAVRIIRNFVERWDRTPLQEQEAIMGRHKANGAPLDSQGSQAGEHDLPDYANDREGARIGLQAHIRLANPRTPGSQTSLILRRPFNYSNGVSRSGQLEMGLLFIAYQADLEAGFITVQKRLNNEPLEEYIKPIGGGYFFTLPGISTAGDFLGRSLLEAASA
jgi:deferrochelatase/peroxidase EfeB